MSNNATMDNLEMQPTTNVKLVMIAVRLALEEAATIVNHVKLDGS